MTKKLPLIELTIDPEKNKFVSVISIVSSPAVESSFLAFKNDNINKHFSFSEERRELLGIAMKADVPIYRYDQQIGEYAVTFSPATIREIAQTFFRKNLAGNMNIEHSNEDADSFVFQSYIVDSSKGMNAPTGLEEAKDGDWIVGVKVLSDEVWENIKNGKQKGFSVEGAFDLIDAEQLVDYQFNNLQPSNDMVLFSKEFEAELDAMILKYGL